MLDSQVVVGGKASDGVTVVHPLAPATCLKTSSFEIPKITSLDVQTDPPHRGRDNLPL